MCFVVIDSQTTDSFHRFSSTSKEKAGVKSLRLIPRNMSFMIIGIFLQSTGIKESKQHTQDGFNYHW